MALSFNKTRLTSLIGMNLLLLMFLCISTVRAGDKAEGITPSATQYAALEKEGLAALDEFMVTFNSGDSLTWAKTLHYPHVRLAGGKVQIWNTPEDYARDNDLSALAKKSSWGYSVWDWRKLVQADPDKMHFAVQFTRYTPDHKKIVSYESFYILTKTNGKWGTQFRSSYAGIAAEKSAF